MPASKLDSILAGAANGMIPGGAPLLAASLATILGKAGVVPDKGYDWYKKDIKDRQDESSLKHPELFTGASLGTHALSIPLGAKTLMGLIP